MDQQIRSNLPVTNILLESPNMVAIRRMKEDQKKKQKYYFDTRSFEFSLPKPGEDVVIRIRLWRQSLTRERLISILGKDLFIW
ncbi:hypothetical protein Y1Q_0017677 [Alligator mississippiensis]|uniref:Uncharacterized protein n=1 Tax=Alligator mississippiensis TaxID=8496 RepID=A0A151NFT8_ALLMI|nr:hypothetical protein Y1Q_0017677 [Alligator mississippiensis]